MSRVDPQAVAACAVLAILAVFAVVSAPAPPSPVQTYASTGYNADGYHGWSTLLAREGVATTRFVLRPIELDGGIDTLISVQPPAGAADASARTAADAGALARWVRAGGRLVYAGRFPGLAEAERHLLELPVIAPAVGSRGALTGPLAPVVAPLGELDADRILLVEHPGRALLSDFNGDIVVDYPLGRGEVVAVNGGRPFTNANLTRAENARLAFVLGTPRRRGGIVAFDDGIHGALVDRPWYRALPVPMRVGLGIAAAALLLGMSGSILGGPAPMRLSAAREPNSGEFIDALAALYERTGARAAVRSILFADAVASAARSVGLPDDAPPAEVAERLAGDPVRPQFDRLIAALEAPVRTDADLLASAKLAYIVRKGTTHDPNGDRRLAAFAGGPRTRRRR